MRMRHWLLTLSLLSVVPAAQAQLSDIFRSVTGALRGGREAPQQQQGVTPTIGIRGMDEGEAKAKAAGPATEDAALMDGWAATKAEAARMAQTKGLVARPVTLGKPEAAPPAP